MEKNSVQHNKNLHLIRTSGKQEQSFRQSLEKIALWCELVKLEHTVFALPFALSGLILGSASLPSLSKVLWTVMAFVGARTAAMSLNRVIDAEIDRLNPRTQQRAIPRGDIRTSTALMLAFLSFGLMIVAAKHLPPICLQLAPIAVLWLSFYSFTKRFTWVCHFVLGIALGGAALGGWLAAGGRIDHPGAWLLALAVATWVAGFDIIYGCLDYTFDLATKLCSIPSRFGIKTALIISSALHIVTTIALVALGLFLQLGIFYWMGTVVVALMLVWEHNLVKSDDLSRVNAAFFNVNGIISISTFFFILLDRILG